MNTRMLKIAGVVLCGGRSSRMGSDKSQLQYRGLALSEYMSHLLHEAGIKQVFLSGPDGITDILPGLGPLGGIHSSMRALSGSFSHILFVPVDMPLLNPAQLHKLSWQDSAAEALHYAEQVFPLRLALTAQTRGTLDEQVAESSASRRSIRNFINALHTVSLPVEACDLESFSNINTPQDWSRLILSSAQEHEIA
jgi:molybdopterin-guanine dinucleotide biosynthesis protein A